MANDQTLTPTRTPQPPQPASSAPLPLHTVSSPREGMAVSVPQPRDSLGGLGQRRQRRKGEPLKRSKTGCATCKRRGKKCDETWSTSGSCERCAMGGWDCAGPSVPTKLARKPRRSTASDSRQDSASPIQKSPTPLADEYPEVRVVPVDLDVDVGGDVNGDVNTGHLVDLAVQLDTTLPIPPALQPPLPPLPLSTPSTSTSTSSIPSYNPGSTIADPQPTPFSVGSLFQQIPLPPQPLWDWPVASAAGPSAYLTTTPNGSLAIDSTPMLWSTDSTETTKLWDDIDMLFNPGTDAHFATSLEPQPALSSGSRVLLLSGDKPMRRGVSLAEIYARVVESWLVGLPGPTRDFARARILAMNDNNTVLRAVRYAVAAAYIFLFASDPSGGPTEGSARDTIPKLVELACMGAGIVENGTTGAAGLSHTAEGNVGSANANANVNVNANGHVNGNGNGNGNAFRKIRLYVDHVSTPFAADLDSTKWTEDAVQELRTVVLTERSQLSDYLMAVIDLQLVEFIRGGAAPSYNMLALGDRLVRSVFREAQPPLYLSHLNTSDTFSLRLYALSDVSRCLVQRGRKTIFNLRRDPIMPGTATATNPGDEPWAHGAYLGLPDAIVVLLADIANLCADMPTNPAATVKARADAIEAELRAWSPAGMFGGPAMVPVDPTTLVARTIAGSLWSLCALVVLYQSVHRVGGLHPVLRHARSEMLSLLDSIVRLPNHGDLYGFLALPAFLSATLSVSDSDRKRAMTHMTRPGPERVWLDNIALVEKLWEETDQTGQLAEWHDKMTREGLSVAFF
ncbi:hypothetical protein EHS25_001110 [Saitozyma podzolica]|uniref:Zn(2)-C6 fungal-type domain-containing protein n=1 Tax=Saitozyma podzolica TaxID=1890683 RepID=A0A427YH76_9TREE|nr:hypothetical protein EHS25_001110 [Saitozyma podzolica]